MNLMFCNRGTKSAFKPILFYVDWNETYTLVIAKEWCNEINNTKSFSNMDCKNGEIFWSRLVPHLL